MDVVAGYAGAFAIGLILGLMGGGGSILTVPLLVYVMALNPVTATAYSLFIVGATSATGSVQNYYKGNLDWKTGLFIAIPSFISVYITRRYIVPALPEVILQINNIVLYKDVFIMLLFAVIMALASFSMLRKRPSGDVETTKLKYIYMLPVIIIIGLLMGLVGAGGGFLIIPMLVIFGGLTMKKSVGTSLFIIALNTLIGFLGDIQTLTIDWSFILTFTAISIFGIFAGMYLQRFINDTQLRKGFGWFVLLMACFILSKEIIGF